MAINAQPVRLLANRPMHWRQFAAIALCCAINAIDGYDILAVSFAAPGLAQEWGVSKAALGVVLSMELIGMAIGSVLLGQIADRWGRRPGVILCLSIMAGGMAVTARADSVEILGVLRLLTGVGLGGMLAATSAMIAEYANDRFRNAAIALMAAGYPFGGAVGGVLASGVLAHGDWRDVFLGGAAASAAMLLFVLPLLPETPDFLAGRRGAQGIVQVNRSLARLGHPPIPRLPDETPASARPTLASLFNAEQRAATLLLTTAYFSHVVTFYFVLKWVPKVVADLGFDAAQAGSVLVHVSLGGLAGALTFSALSLRVQAMRLLIVGTLAGAATVVAFGQVPHAIAALKLAGAAAGFATNGVLVLFYAAAANAFPTDLRARGSGFMLGTGRGGAALGPVLAGLLFSAGMSLPVVCAILGVGSLVSALTLWRLARRSDSTG